MADKGIPDYLREYDLDADWGFTPVSKAPLCDFRVAKLV